MLLQKSTKIAKFVFFLRGEMRQNVIFQIHILLQNLLMWKMFETQNVIFENYSFFKICFFEKN